MISLPIRTVPGLNAREHWRARARRVRSERLAARVVLSVPLCPEHHRGSSGLHGLGVRGFERRHRLDEMDLLAMTIEDLT